MLQVFVTLLLLISFEAIAFTHDQSFDSGSSDKEEYLPWWASDDSEMRVAACKTLGPPSIDQIENEINFKRGTSLASKQVFGVDIENDSPVLIEALINLTTRTAKHGGSWGGIHAPQIDLQEEFSINPICDKVTCAVKKIWGRELGLKILWIYLKHGFNSSEYAFDSTDRFSLPEIDDVIMALEDLPATIVPLAFMGNQRLVPIDRESADSNTVANSTIILMNSWRLKSSLTRQQTLFHELGHNMSLRFLSKESLKQWEMFSGWESTRNGWRFTPGACFISEYAKTSPGEDFAESVVAYRYGPEKLKSKCPQKYDFLHSHIFGIEYLNSHECKNIK